MKTPIKPQSSALNILTKSAPTQLSKTPSVTSLKPSASSVQQAASPKTTVSEIKRRATIGAFSPKTSPFAQVAPTEHPFYDRRCKTNEFAIFNYLAKNQNARAGISLSIFNTALTEEHEKYKNQLFNNNQPMSDDHIIEFIEMLINDIKAKGTAKNQSVSLESNKMSNPSL